MCTASAPAGQSVHTRSHQARPPRCRTAAARARCQTARWRWRPYMSTSGTVGLTLQAARALRDRRCGSRRGESFRAARLLQICLGPVNPVGERGLASAGEKLTARPGSLATSSASMASMGHVFLILPRLACFLFVELAGMESWNLEMVSHRVHRVSSHLITRPSGALNLAYGSDSTDACIWRHVGYQPMTGRIWVAAAASRLTQCGH